MFSSTSLWMAWLGGRNWYAFAMAVVVVVELREVREDLLLVVRHEELVSLHQGERRGLVREVVRLPSELSDRADGLAGAEQLADPPLVELRGRLVDGRGYLLVLLALLDLGPRDIAFADAEEAGAGW